MGERFVYGKFTKFILPKECLLCLIYCPLNVRFTRIPEGLVCEKWQQLHIAYDCVSYTMLLLQSLAPSVIIKFRRFFRGLHQKQINGLCKRLFADNQSVIARISGRFQENFQKSSLLISEMCSR